LTTRRSVKTSLSETIVPLASTIQNIVVDGGLARIAHATVTSVSPRYAPTELHVIFGLSAAKRLNTYHTSSKRNIRKNIGLITDAASSKCNLLTGVCFTSTRKQPASYWFWSPRFVILQICNTVIMFVLATTQDKKLSCRKEAAWCFVSLNIYLNHSKLFKVSPSDTLE